MWKNPIFSHLLSRLLIHWHSDESNNQYCTYHALLLESWFKGLTHHLRNHYATQAMGATLSKSNRGPPLRLTIPHQQRQVMGLQSSPSSMSNAQFIKYVQHIMMWIKGRHAYTTKYGQVIAFRHYPDDLLTSYEFRVPAPSKASLYGTVQKRPLRSTNTIANTLRTLYQGHHYSGKGIHDEHPSTRLQVTITPKPMNYFIDLGTTPQGQMPKGLPFDRGPTSRGHPMAYNCFMSLMNMPNFKFATRELKLKKRHHPCPSSPFHRQKSWNKRPLNGQPPRQMSTAWLPFDRGPTQRTSYKIAAACFSTLYMFVEVHPCSTHSP